MISRIFEQSFIIKNHDITTSKPAYKYIKIQAVINIKAQFFTVQLLLIYTKLLIYITLKIPK